MKKLAATLVILIILLLTSATFSADNWPTWRGPNMTGISGEATPPTSWSESKNIKWKIKLEGDGSPSTPVIWQDKLFYQIAVDTGKKGKAVEQETPSSGSQRIRGSVRNKANNIFRLDLVGRDVHSLTVDENGLVRYQLASLRTRHGKSHAVHHVIQPAFQQTQQVFTGGAFLLGC